MVSRTLRHYFNYTKIEQTRAADKNIFTHGLDTDAKTGINPLYAVHYEGI